MEKKNISDQTDCFHGLVGKTKGVTTCQLAQKDYDAKIITLVEEEIVALKTYLKTAPSIQALYTQMCPARQSLIITMETNKEPLTPDIINQMIHEFLL